MRWLPGLVLVLALLAGRAASAQTPPAAAPAPPTFRAGVERVMISAVVRDSRSRLVTNLVQSDFEVLDKGVRRPITDFRAERAAVSVALLFDFSGSMQMAEKVESARLAARHVLTWLNAGRDELAIYSFDTALHQLEPFAPYREDATLERSLFGIAPFGMTSLNDAIAATAKDVAARPNSHRAVVVLTDGLDNHSVLSAAEASGIASSIDVPVYIMAVVSPLDHVGAATAVSTESPLPVGNLADLARWTGGEFFVTSATEQTRLAAQRIVDELRHQYLIAFEPASQPGWRPLEVRTRNRKLVVRARGGYIAGQRPASPEAAAAGRPGREIALFEGTSMKDWQVLGTVDFDGHGEVAVKDGELVLGAGRPMTGVKWAGRELPKTNYEVTLEARRIDGGDFFCGMTFPVTGVARKPDPGRLGRQPHRPLQPGRPRRVRERNRWLDDIRAGPVVQGPAAGHPRQNRSVGGRQPGRGCRDLGPQGFAAVGDGPDAAFRIRHVQDHGRVEADPREAALAVMTGESSRPETRRRGARGYSERTGIVSTGRRAWRTTFSATEPNMTRSQPVEPWVAMTMRSTASSLAIRTTSLPASPCPTIVRTTSPSAVSSSRRAFSCCSASA